MEFGQLIEYNKRNIFLKKSCRENELRRLVPDLIVFVKSFIYGKCKWCAAWFHYISIAHKLAYNKSKLYKTFDHWSRDMVNFEFWEKGLGIVSTPHFVYDFSTEMFLMLHSINSPNFIVWLSSLLEILGNMCIEVVC